MPSRLFQVRGKCLPTVWLCSMFFVGGCSQLIRTPVTHQKVQPSEFGQKFTPEELRSDLDFLLKTCESVHPNLYANVSREEIAAIKSRGEAEITEPMTRVKFYPMVARIVSRINDSHTSGGFPFEEWNAYVNSRNGPCSRLRLITRRRKWS